MELNLSELNNTNTNNPYSKSNYNSYDYNNVENYWETPPKVEEIQTKKKKISFDDILSNMNLVVNNKGVLQFMAPNQEEIQCQNYNNPNEFAKQPPQQNKNLQPIESAVKHSYIFNKYFKDYSDINTEKPGPRVPKTIEEYNQMLLEDKIKQIEHRKMIEEVKSKKMMFTTAPGSTSNPRNLRASRNNLRMMNFS
jgi:hypothetical protein